MPQKFRHVNRKLHSLVYALCTCAILLAISPFTRAQNPQDYDSERKRAFQLYNDGKYTEALPVFEKLAAAKQDDREVLEVFGLLVLGTSMHFKDPAERKQARLRARTILLRAKDLGANDLLFESMLASVPADGGDDVKFSAKREVDDAMRDGEAAFAKADYEKAIAAYERALLFDPTQYEAALFTGDAYFGMKQPERAGEWYLRATRIDPNRETAYRYWSDVLLKSGKMEESRDKAIEAIIAEPFKRLTFNGLIQWAETNKVSLGHPKIEIPTNVIPKENGDVTIMLDPSVVSGKSDGSAAWMMYGITRSMWLDKKGARSEKFAKQYPNEKNYRHSLAEESEALHLVAESVRTQLKEKQASKLDPSLANLVKLDDAGLLEAYILFARPDEGIAKDYAAYRQANRDKLKRYWLEVVIGTK
jgi:tetratricopeptide (TPR) repeat protein